MTDTNERPTEHDLALTEAVVAYAREMERLGVPTGDALVQDGDFLLVDDLCYRDDVPFECDHAYLALCVWRSGHWRLWQQYGYDGPYDFRYESIADLASRERWDADYILQACIQTLADAIQRARKAVA